MSATNKDFLTRCPICGAQDVSRTYRYPEFDVLSCRSCANAWRSNMYSPQRIREIYVESDYAEHPYFEATEGGEDRDARRIANFHKALSLIESRSPGRKLLDVGCGAGTFLAIAKQRGWQAHGVELSPGLSRKCADTVQVPVSTSSFEEAPLSSESFDAITFWDVIEHVTDPMSCVSKAFEVLTPGGHVLFCTPDEESFLARLGSLFYRVGYTYPSYALHPPNHTYFFSRRGFRQMLIRAGLRPGSEYSQEAFFEHSPLASSVQKLGIAAIEKAAQPFDRQYEAVFLAQKPQRAAVM
jgi:2-polyprenyl-3-methyl-5-hydroxy-6-metoxy-1,4-benzoquinol methylase